MNIKSMQMTSELLSCHDYAYAYKIKLKNLYM